MGVGVALTTALLGDGALALPLFACLSATHLLCVHQSLAAVQLRTLSMGRLRLACRPALAQLRAAAMQPITAPGVPAEEAAALPALRVLSPAEVARLEPVLPWASPAAPPLPAAAGERVPIASGTPISRLPGFAAAWRSQAGGGEAGVKHVIVVERSSRFRTWPLKQPGDSLVPSRRGICSDADFRDASIHVLFALDAAPRDVLYGAFHAILTAEMLAPAQLNDAGTEDAVRAARAIADRAAVSLCEALEREGWWVGVPVLAAEVGGRLSRVAAAVDPTA